ncbi:L-fucose isomerase [Paenibacillus sp. 598K]|uniref:L-fucose isomerase n=1 Tax=Paenibacillus sp. 598K TaxID=1117987 RepID=UPI000FF97D4E|nr:L-fucose isomerase [Paenibacillus sp. 598K]GBF71806.1 L-fucose isomerase [Paenibacillus sp. 598K]
MGSWDCYRYQGEFPTIGIRPAIDGRRGGVRESLEAVAMGMAERVASLLASELRYPNGDPVTCVIADRCIGGAVEAAAATEQFARAGVGLVITVSPCWCYGGETLDMSPYLPQAIWGFNGTERPGAVYLAAALASHNQKGLPAFAIYGREVQDAGEEAIPADVQEKLLRFARCGLAVALMRGKAYLSMGTVSMGIAGCVIDERLFQRYLGMRNEYIDMSEFSRRIEQGIYDQEEYERALAWTRQHCAEGADGNKPELQLSRSRKDEDWETVVKMTLIARDLMAGNPRLAGLGWGEEALGHQAIAAGFQGQRQWTDYRPNGDFMEAILNSSFDWNGKREPYILATENDSLNGVVMLMGHLLTNTAQVFADVRSYWSPDAVERVAGVRPGGLAAGGFIHLINSGPAALDGTGEQQLGGEPAMKPHWAITDEEVQRCLAAVSWCPANREYFRGGGYSTDFTTRGGMKVTVVRLNLIHGIGPVLQLAEGYTVELPEEVHAILDQRTDSAWPTTWFVPRLIDGGQGPFRDVFSVMKHWGSNHCALSYGHIGADLITLASMLRIPVTMHNVAEELIYRPGAWDAFGAHDSFGADYRACANFGPLYGSFH